VTVVIGTTEDSVTLSVSDEGPGIRGDITRIFQRFYTDRPEGESFGDHSGLGLAISRQIIEAHGGTVVAANRTDRSGARFTVTLRRAAVERRR
jgi:two-component system sensor histidine kinase ChvG